MNREKLAWIVSMVFIGILCFQVPGTMAQRDDDYLFVRTLVDIHRHVVGHYVDEVDEASLRTAAIDGMLSELDPFSSYIPPDREEEFDRVLEGSFKGVGIQLNQLEDGSVEVVSPIEGSPAFKAGVLPGDRVLKVNGDDIEGMRLPEIIKKISGPLGSTVNLRVRRTTGEEADLTMVRQEIVVPTVKGYQRGDDQQWDWFILKNPRIAYVHVTQFTPETGEKVRAALQQLLSQGMEGLILDLRFNPGGRLDEARDICDLFLEDGVIVSTRGRNRPEQVLTATRDGTLPYFPMIVLINGHSASASEIVAGSLMDNKRALVMGSRSYGKGSVQELVPLDDDAGKLKLTVGYYYLPSGRLVHRKKDATDWGVEPQISVPVDAATEQKIIHERYERELYRRPRSTTAPATAPAASADIQLERAVDTMAALLVFDGQRKAPPASQPAQQMILDIDEASNPPATEPAVPVTQPATVPASE